MGLKIEEGYWIGEHFLDQSQKKALSIPKALYPSYILLFILNNSTSHLVYTKDVLQVVNMKKDCGGQ